MIYHGFDIIDFDFDIYHNGLVAQSDQNIYLYRLKRFGKVSLLDKKLNRMNK